MKKLAPYLLTCLTVICFLLLPSKAQASHAAGGEIIYEHISDSTYRVFFKFYRDCTGTTTASSYTLCYKNTCNPTDVRDTVLNQWPGLIPPGVTNGSPVALGCSNASTSCDVPAGNMPGYNEYWYYAIVRLPYQCNYWTFSVSISARNSSSNISSPGYFYVETTFNNAYAQGNTSPYFSNKPIPYCCINTPYTYNNGAVDPDGDSLVTEVINPLTNNGGCDVPTNCSMQTLTPPISFPSNPLQTNNSFVLNPATGSMSFTPTVAGAWATSVRTKEYRNGVLIGTIMRDVQIQVISPCSVVAPAPPNPTASLGGNVVNGQVQGCIGQPLNFCFDVKSADPDAVLIASDNSNLSLGGNALATYTNQKNDSVRGCVSWTPHKTGLYNLTVTVKDSTCRPPGILITNTFTVPVYIWPKVKASADTTVCPGDPVQLNVTGGGSYTWGYLSGPNGSLNTTSGPNPIAGPYATTEYVVTSTVNPWCGDATKDTVKINVEQAITFTSIDNKIVCPGQEIQLDLQVVKEPGVTYTYKWTPNGGLTPPGSENPKVKPTGDITYRVEISASNNTCKAYDTVAIDVLDGITLLSHDTAICEGEKVKVNAKGDARYKFSWESFDSNGQNPAYNVSPADSAITEITPNTLGNFTYKLKGEYLVNGVKMCPDTTVEFDIEMQPIPTVELPDDATICYGDTMKIYSTVTPLNYTKWTYSWSPGQALDNPNSKDPIFSAYATTTLKMTASSSAGCKDEEELVLTVLPSDFMTVSNDTSICPNDTAQLHMVGVGLKSFFWSIDNNISSKLNTDPFVWPTSTQIYHVYGRDTNQCYDTQSVRVTVKPAAILNLPDSVRIYPGESYQMDPQGNGLYFNWFPHVGLSYANISNPVAKPDVNTRYTVSAITEFGCKATDVIDVLVSPDSYIDMPNAFIPGNGLNGTLKVVKLGDAKLKGFAIFNRWGLKVFETSDVAQGWDGRYNGEAQPMGVYVYTIEAVTPAGRKFTKQGNITLIR